VRRPELAPDTLAQLVAYDWPGNVRELKNVAERLIVRHGGGLVTPADLPVEVLAPPRQTATERSAADNLFDRLAHDRELFWDLVYPAFMARDLTREDLRAVVRKGLQRTGGSYKLLIQLFNMPSSDYKRFLNFLRKHGCQVAFNEFRIVRPPDDAPGVPRSERASGET
jgi:DNA-binding NtrC family response regulator